MHGLDCSQINQNIVNSMQLFDPTSHEHLGNKVENIFCYIALLNGNFVLISDAELEVGYGSQITMTFVFGE